MNHDDAAERRSGVRVWTVLAGLYPETRQAQRVADEACVPTVRVHLSGSALDFWHGLVTEAEKLGRLDALLAVARREYPGTAGLDDASGSVPNAARMNPLLDELARAASRCDEAALPIETEPLRGLGKRLLEAAASVGRAWSGAWIGYHSRLYLAHLRPRAPGDIFDREWGLVEAWSNQTTGAWEEYTLARIEAEIVGRAGVQDLQPLESAAHTARRAFAETRHHVVPTLDAILADREDAALRRVRDEIERLGSHIGRRAYFESRCPREVATRDRLALAEGIQVPPHIAVEAGVVELLSHGPQLRRLAEQVRRVVVYLQQREKMRRGQ